MFNLYLGDYKRYLVIPAVLFVIFLFLILVFPGVKQGIDLKGGINIIVRSDMPLDSDLIKDVLESKYPLAELQVGSISSPTGNGLFIQFLENTDIAEAQSLLDRAESDLESNPQSAQDLALESISFSSKYIDPPNTSNLSTRELVSLAALSFENANDVFQLGLQSTITETFNLEGELKFQIKEIGPSLGENFFSSALTVTLVAFVLVIIVVYLFFREIIPSVAVIAASIFDIAGALALMAVFSIPLSLSTIPALLMLIGYSVDTDVMLTTRLLKRFEKNPRQRTHDSMITGLTMTITTLAALVAMITLSYFGQIQVFFEISAVLLFGLLADILSTWLMNAPVLLWYVEKKEESS